MPCRKLLWRLSSVRKRGVIEHLNTACWFTSPECTGCLVVRHAKAFDNWCIWVNFRQSHMIFVFLCSQWNWKIDPSSEPSGSNTLPALRPKCRDTEGRCVIMVFILHAKLHKVVFESQSDILQPTLLLNKLNGLMKHYFRFTIIYWRALF